MFYFHSASLRVLTTGADPLDLGMRLFAAEVLWCDEHLKTRTDMIIAPASKETKFFQHCHSGLSGICLCF
jgi:hypothetical protein